MTRRTNKKNKGNEVYSTIRDDIVRGRYPGGTFLVEGELCRELGVSRTPVREALIRLENDRFIQLIPNRGAYVPQMSLSDIIELCQLRLANDALATKLSCERQTEELLLALDESIRREELLAEEGASLEKVFEEDAGFHRALVDGCGNQRLIDMLDLIEHQLQRVTLSATNQDARTLLAANLENHKKTLEAFKAHDSNAAKLASEAHWQDMLDRSVGRDFQGHVFQLR